MLTTSLFLLFCTFPGDPLAGIDQLMAQNPEEAKTQLLAAVADPASEARAHYLLCVLANRQGDQQQEAIDHGEKAAQLLPEDSQAQLQYAIAMRNMFSTNPMYAMSKLQTYKDTLEKAISLDQHNFAAWNEKIGFLMNAPPMAGGSLDQAKQVLAQLQEVDANQGLFMTAALHAKQGEHDQALEAYSRVVAANPDNMQARMAMGYSLMSLNRHPDAVAHFEAMYKDGDYLPALYQAGRARVLGGIDLDTAVARFDAYIARGGTDRNMLSAAHWRKGQALEGLGRGAEALAAYQEAIAIDPDNQNARDSMTKLQTP